MGVEMVPASSVSRPAYGRLAVVDARCHLALVDGNGSGALEALLQDLDPERARALHVIRVGEGTPMPGVGSWQAEGDIHAALSALRRALSTARMGLHLSIAGSEALIGRAMAEARAAGLPDEAITTECRGPSARRIQCMHCKTFMEGVRVSPVTCASCGLRLAVRDHYSRRLAAYQAVWVGPAADPPERPLS